MATILITGASGYIGRSLMKQLSSAYDVVGISRHKPAEATTWVRGDFASFEDLRQLDRFSFDAVVHLAAVTGGCLERDGMLVNVEGSRCLMRYLIDRGCRKFVMASSIAAVGLQSPAFRPLSVPIADEHPCFDRDGYGFSKFLMEEVTKYHHRQNPQIDVINLRLAAIFPETGAWGKARAGPIPAQWALGGISGMPHDDAVRAFALAATSPLKPGVRTMNATSARAWSDDPTATVLRAWWGDDVDLSHFEQPGHAFESVFNVNRIREELGFVA
jgi:UDP-glucose 4-epimerase